VRVSSPVRQAPASTVCGTTTGCMASASSPRWRGVAKRCAPTMRVSARPPTPSTAARWSKLASNHSSRCAHTPTTAISECRPAQEGLFAHPLFGCSPPTPYFCASLRHYYTNAQQNNTSTYTHAYTHTHTHTHVSSCTTHTH
jgi:hypothetical protein